MTDDGFDELAAYVEEELDFATTYYNDSYLERRFGSRMRRCEAEDYHEYRELLADDEAEAAALLDALSINVTGFFRNPDVWEGIRERLRECFDEAGSGTAAADDGAADREAVPDGDGGQAADDGASGDGSNGDGSSAGDRSNGDGSSAGDGSNGDGSSAGDEGSDDGPAGGDGTVRVWSAACADGREPYSLSMLAHDDPECDAGDLEVVATDINEQTLEHAREGVYRSTRTIDVADQLSFLSNYDDYVEQSEDRFRIREAVREPVEFERHDLINDAPKEPVDLAICRNLFIYIDNEYKEPVLETLAESTRPGGYLVIGKAETIPPGLQRAFEVDDGRLRIYRRV